MHYTKDSHLNLHNTKSLPSLQSIQTRRLIRRQPRQVVQLLAFLARDVRTHVPRITQREQRLRVHRLDVRAPLLRRWHLRLDGVDVLFPHLGDRFNDPVDLGLDEGGAV